jgi:hypothetical protein
MIVAIEGAPGVGKSTVAAALAADGAYVIPEVNLLFARPDPEPPHWYFERQVARWEMARLRAATGTLAVLDGDPFQPLWFRWIFADEGWPRDPAAFSFFRDRIARGRMGFPALYVFAHIAETERRARMLAREMSRGCSPEAAMRKTDHYARMAEPQRRFFAAIGARFPGWVLDLETTSVGQSAAAIQAAAAGAAAPPAGLEALDFIEAWLAGYPARA